MRLLLASLQEREFLLRKEKRHGLYLGPLNTVLLGQVSYAPGGEKIFITFGQGLYPDGGEFKIEALGPRGR